MYERKLTDAIIEKYDIGYDGNWQAPGRNNITPCITFPVHDINGNVLFIYRRSIEGKFFSMPEGIEKPVYGMHQLPSNAKSVVIAESIFNALTAVAYGYPAIALLGTGNSQQMKELQRSGIYDFVICMDGDEAGQRATRRIKKALSGIAITWEIRMPEGKDINDCTKEEFDALYENKF